MDLSPPRRLVRIPVVAQGTTPVAQSHLKPGAPVPLSLYVHFPWCLSKCPYCDFNSHGISPEKLPHADYVKALQVDLESQLPSVWGRTVQTLFMGGGTPSLFPAHAIDQCLAMIRARLPLAPDAEITLEANPGSFETGRFTSFRDAGINRLSVGVQSFRDDHLSVLGRAHDAAQAHLALTEARRVFDNLNIDLIVGLPGQTPEQARSDVQTALDHDPDHVSVYQLTLEPNTVFYKFPPAGLPDEDQVDAIQDAVDDLLDQAGFVHYEVSAYAQPGRQSRHNLNYWQFGDYLGIGAGAHGKISTPTGIFRTEQSRVPDRYLGQQRSTNALPLQRSLGRADLVFEFALNAFRLRDGFASSLFADRTGLEFAAFLPGLTLAQQRGLIRFDGSWIHPTPLGRRFLNDLQAIFLGDDAGAR